MASRHLYTYTTKKIKCVDFHPSEPLILLSFFNGTIEIYNHESRKVVKSASVSAKTIRSAKFIARKGWFITIDDAARAKVFDIMTFEKVAEFEAGLDFLRCVTVHNEKPYVIISGDDMYIRIFNWEKNWKCEKSYDSHTYYVMQTELNPKNKDQFASASLDGVCYIWSVNSEQPLMILNPRSKALNTVDYCFDESKPYVAVGGDDFMVRIYDYQTRSPIHRFEEAHLDNVTAVRWHPMNQNILLSTGEDGKVNVYNTSSMQIIKSFHPNMGIGWSISVFDGSNKFAVAFDEGVAFYTLGDEEPIASMSKNKLLLAHGREVKSYDQRGENTLGQWDFDITSLAHNTNGRFTMVSSAQQGKWAVFSTLSWRLRFQGKGTSPVWSGINDSFAFLDRNTVEIHSSKDNTQIISIKVDSVSSLFGGSMLGVYSKRDNTIDFYDWETCELVDSLEAEVLDVLWDGNMLAIRTFDTVFVLALGEEGFEFLEEIVIDCSSFFFVSRCLFMVGNSKVSIWTDQLTLDIHVLDEKVWIMGYVSKDRCLRVINKKGKIIDIPLSFEFLKFATTLEMDLIPSIEDGLRDKLSRHYHLHDEVELAFSLAVSNDFKFRIAKEQQWLERMLEVASKSDLPDVADLCLKKNDVDQAIKCYREANDYSSLLMIASTVGDAALVEECVENLEGAVQTLFGLQYLGRKDDIVNLLNDNQMQVEKRIYERTYPEMTPVQMQVAVEEEVVAPVEEEESIIVEEEPKSVDEEITEELESEVPVKREAEPESTTTVEEEIQEEPEKVELDTDLSEIEFSDDEIPVQEPKKKAD
ncbi:hypothetical protein PCE1_000937 [Barthelona sp. PCE]